MKFNKQSVQLQMLHSSSNKKTGLQIRFTMNNWTMANKCLILYWCPTSPQKKKTQTLLVRPCTIFIYEEDLQLENKCREKNMSGEDRVHNYKSIRLVFTFHLFLHLFFFLHFFHLFSPLLILSHEHFCLRTFDNRKLHSNVTWIHSQMSNLVHWYWYTVRQNFTIVEK
jgi:hypothetical protein